MSATAVAEIPVGLPFVSNVTPSPRKSGKIHHRIAETPAARIAARSVSYWVVFWLTPFWLHMARPPKSVAKLNHA